MILYDSSFAPNPRRVRIFLAEKGVEVPIQQIDIGKGGEPRVALHRQEPARRPAHAGARRRHLHRESVAICRYFEEKHPDPPLMGVDAVDRAVVEMWNRRMEFELLQTIASAFRHTHEFFKGRVTRCPSSARRAAWRRRRSSSGSIVSWRIAPSSPATAYTIADITALCGIDFGRVSDIRVEPERRTSALVRNGVVAAQRGGLTRRCAEAQEVDRLSEAVIARRSEILHRWAAAALLTGALLVAATSAPAADRGADGQFEKRTSSHFALYQDVDIDETGGLRGSRRFEQQVLEELERAYDRLDDFLALRPATPHRGGRLRPRDLRRELRGAVSLSGGRLLPGRDPGSREHPAQRPAGAGSPPRARPRGLRRRGAIVGAAGLVQRGNRRVVRGAHARQAPPEPRRARLPGPGAPERRPAAARDAERAELRAPGSERGDRSPISSPTA